MTNKERIMGTPIPPSGDKSLPEIRDLSREINAGVPQSSGAANVSRREALRRLASSVPVMAAGITIGATSIGEASMKVLEAPETGAARFTSNHPDAQLFALEAELKAADDRMKEAGRRLEEVETRYFAVKPPEPERLPLPEAYEQMYREMTVGQFQMLAPDHPLVVWERENEERNRAPREAYESECARLRRECGVPAANDESDRSVDVVFDIGERIFATPAHTPAGMQVKIRTVILLNVGELNEHNVFESLCRDINALAEAA